MNGSAQPWPTELKLITEDKRLEVAFDDGAQFSLPAELLRVESPSAEVKGHGPGEKVLVAGKRQVGISKLEPVGNYAVRILFDDGHDTGLYTWRYLYELGQTQDRLMSAYVAAIEAKGLSRD